jgi:heme exporter protein D
VSAHALYVAAAYGLSAIVLVLLIGWLFLDDMLRRRELADLEEQGVRRRSERRKA